MLLYVCVRARARVYLLEDKLNLPSFHLKGEMVRTVFILYTSRRIGNGLSSIQWNGIRAKGRLPLTDTT